MNKKITFLLMISFFAFLITSCSSDDDNGTTKTVVESFSVQLNSANSIPTVSNRNETGIVEMDLYDDNSLEFTITVNNLSSSDSLTAAHVHTGDVVSTGDVAILLVGGDITFSGNTASGTINLTSDQVATLQGNNIYVNVHSTQSPPGLVRGQVDQTIDNAYNVALSPDNQIPAVIGRNETGNAYFRLVGSTMFFKVTINDLDANDAITAGHIHEGNSTVNGPVLINFNMTGNSDLNVTKSITLSSAELNKVNNDDLYVNIHTSLSPAGLVRGQIR